MQGVGSQKTADLPRTLGLPDAVAIVVGIVIGGGIFIVPNLVARNLGTSTAILGVWIFGGVVTFFGALAAAELGAAMPATGGQYVYLREIYGPLGGFLYGWSMFLVCRTAQAAWLATTLALYVSYFVPLGPVGSRLLEAGALILLTAINYRGVYLSALVQKFLASAKVVGLLVIIGSAFLLRARVPAMPSTAAAPFSMSHFGLALMACVLAYDGWAQMTDVAGEIKRPQRTILAALVFGVGIVIIVYVLANAAYLHLLSPAEIAASDHVGATAAERVLGPAGGGLVAFIIVLSIIGSLNGVFMTGPRIYFAQARNGLFFSKFAEIHPRFQTPAFAIVAQAVWSMVLLLTGTYETLVTYAIPAAWFFYALMVLGVMLLRAKRPDLPRPYRMWGYPFTPLLFLIVAVAFIANSMIEQPGPTLAAFGLIAAGVPVFFLWGHRRDRQRA